MTFAKGASSASAGKLIDQAKASAAKMVALRDQKGGGERHADLRKEMAVSMEQGCGIYRTAPEMQATCDKLGELKRRYRDLTIEDRSSVWNTDWLAAVNSAISSTSPDESGDPSSGSAQIQPANGASWRAAALLGMLSAIARRIIRDTGLDHRGRYRLLRPPQRIGIVAGSVLATALRFGGHGIPRAPTDPTARSDGSARQLGHVRPESPSPVPPVAVPSGPAPEMLRGRRDRMPRPSARSPLSGSRTAPCRRTAVAAPASETEGRVGGRKDSSDPLRVRRPWPG